MIFLFCWKMVILRIFWGSSEFSEDYFFVQSWSSSEFSEDWFVLKNCSSSEFSEEFLFFESLPSSQFSDDPQNFLRIDPLLFESWSSSKFSIFWGLKIFCVERLSSSENSEDPQNFSGLTLCCLKVGHPQNFLRILRIFWEWWWWKKMTMMTM